MLNKIKLVACGFLVLMPVTAGAAASSSAEELPAYIVDTLNKGPVCAFPSMMEVALTPGVAKLGPVPEMMRQDGDKTFHLSLKSIQATLTRNGKSLMVKGKYAPAEEHINSLRFDWFLGEPQSWRMLVVDSQNKRVIAVRDLTPSAPSVKVSTEGKGVAVFFEKINS